MAHYRIPDTTLPRLVNFRRLSTDWPCRQRVQAGSAVPHRQAEASTAMQPLAMKPWTSLYWPHSLHALRRPAWEVVEELDPTILKIRVMVLP